MVLMVRKGDWKYEIYINSAILEYMPVLYTVPLITNADNVKLIHCCKLKIDDTTVS